MYFNINDRYCTLRAQQSGRMCSHNEESDDICQGRGFTLYRSMIITVSLMPVCLWGFQCKRQQERQKQEKEKKILQKKLKINKNIFAICLLQFQTNLYFTGDIHPAAHARRITQKWLLCSFHSKKQIRENYFSTVTYSNDTVSEQSYVHIITATVISSTSKACHMQSIQYWNQLTTTWRLRESSSVIVLNSVL